MRKILLIALVILVATAAMATSYINEKRVSVTVDQVTGDMRYARMIANFSVDPSQVYATGGTQANLPEGARGKCRWGRNASVVYEWAYVSAQESAEMPGVLFDLGKDKDGNTVIVHCQKGSGGNVIVFYGILPCKTERIVVEKTEVVHEQPIEITKVIEKPCEQTPTYQSESCPQTPPTPEAKVVTIERVITITKIVAGMRSGAPYERLREPQATLYQVPGNPGILGYIAPMFYPVAKSYTNISAAASATGGAGGAGGAGGSACVGPITNNLINANNIANQATNNTALSANQAQAQSQ